MNPNDRRTGVGPTTDMTEQYVLNWSFDVVFKLLMVGLAGYNAANNRYDRLQVDDSGNLKVVSAGSTSIPTATDGGTPNLTYVPVGGRTSAGVAKEILTDGAGRMKISHGQPDPVSGSLTALNSAVAIVADGFSDIVFYFGGTSTQTVTFEQSPDSTDGSNGTWFAVLATSQGAVAASATTAANPTGTTYRVSAPAGSYVRVRTSTYTSGTLTVMAVSTTAMVPAQVTSTLNGTSSVNIAAPANTAGYTSKYFAAALTAKAAVKTSRGTVIRMAVYNPNTSPVWLQFFNTALASVTPGTTAPVESFMIPPGNGTTPGYFVDSLVISDQFTTAITIAPWSVPDNSAGAAPAAGLIVNIAYA